MKRKETLSDEFLKDIGKGVIIKCDLLENYIRRMKAFGHSKTSAVETVVTVSELKRFYADSWEDVDSLYALASELYAKA